MIYYVFVYDIDIKKPVKVLETYNHLEAAAKVKQLTNEGKLAFIDYEEK